jgi:RNA polymerase sigma-70 factor (ECF subfamily)
MPARQAALESCLERLPEKSRRLLTLRYAEDASVAEVATAVQSTVGAVRVMLFRIRNLLSHCIEEQLANEGSGQ